MKRIAVMICGAMMLVGCADGPRTQVRPQLAGAADVVLGQDQLGDSWCLLDTSGKTRSQVREAALGAWDAHEIQSPSGGLAACDAGPFKYYMPTASSACIGSPDTNPARDLLKSGGLIAIQRDTNSGVFNVTFKDEHGIALRPDELESKSFAAVGDPSKNRYKWLAGTVVVHRAAHDVIYDAYIYLLDDPAATVKLSKWYRVELFRTNEKDCIAEEPINNDRSRGPFAPGSSMCPARISKFEMRQAPIGDGHHGAANAGVCTY
jgi:hypothetical protein